MQQLFIKANKDLKETLKEFSGQNMQENYFLLWLNKASNGTSTSLQELQILEEFEKLRKSL